MSRGALVTGAHGFIGRHLARHLSDNGWEVTGVGHGGWPEEEWRTWGLARWISGDVSVETLISLPPVDAAFHCAGSSSVRFGVEHPHEDFQRNVASTAALLEWIRCTKANTVVVLTSSAAVYGDTGPTPVQEDRPAHPESVYGSHKLMAEDLCREASRYFGLRTVIVRLFSVYGRGLRKQLLWDGCQKLQRGDLSFDGTGAEERDWLHVEDVATLMSVAEKRASDTAPVVNGGTGAGITIAAVLSKLAESLGTPPPRFRGTQRPGDPAHLVADVSCAQAWGWHFAKAWSEGIHEYCDWFRSVTKNPVGEAQAGMPMTEND